MNKILALIIIVVFATLACGSISDGVYPIDVEEVKSQPAVNDPGKAVPTKIPTTDVRNSESNKVAYLEYEVAWASNCSDVFYEFSEVFGRYTVGSTWILEADNVLSAIENRCSFVSPYNLVPDDYLDIERETVSAKYDYSMAVEYIRQFVHYKDFDAGDLGISYIEKGTVHIQTMTSLLKEMR